MVKTKKVPVPEVGKTYGYFDDGKIRRSRYDIVDVTEIVPFAEIDVATRREWERDVEDCGFLYATTTDVFVKGRSQGVFYGKLEPVVFARTVDGRWFSLEWKAGVLDLDGSLLKRLEDRENKDDAN